MHLAPKHCGLIHSAAQDSINLVIRFKRDTSEGISRSLNPALQLFISQMGGSGIANNLLLRAGAQAILYRTVFSPCIHTYAHTLSVLVWSQLAEMGERHPAES